MCSKLPAIILVGVAAGASGTLLGVGGGAVIVPLLLLLGIPIKKAAPASLVAILGTSLGGLGKLHRKGYVNWKLAIFLETASVLGALMGASLNTTLNEKVLETLLSLILIASAVTIKLRGEPRGREEENRAPKLAAAWLSSMAAGTLSSLLGIGGGLVKVPVLLIILNKPVKEAVSTSKLMVGITALAGIAGYTVKSTIDWRLAIILAASTYTGAALAARILLRIRSRLLRSIATSYYALMGLYILARTLIS